MSLYGLLNSDLQLSCCMRRSVIMPKFRRYDIRAFSKAEHTIFPQPRFLAISWQPFPEAPSNPANSVRRGGARGAGAFRRDSDHQSRFALGLKSPEPPTQESMAAEAPAITDYGASAANYEK